ncbi:uncharacterized protein [Anoplolepis gracilipes]|uniref:uncharacterized protein n=1 Tax=Anoplolepis gracilipes TaxID=354296 RepID=UPI003B9F819E
MLLEMDEKLRSDSRNMQRNERNFEEIRSLSPIEEESESTLCFKEMFQSSNFSEREEKDYKMIRSPYKGCQETLRKMDGDSSSGDERIKPDFFQLKRVKGSYCCFTEASGDNDEAETGLRDKSLKTTVEQLKRRLSQAEREIIVLKKHQSPQKCQSHEKCEILHRDLLTWRNDHEKRIASQIGRWQLAERRRIHDEMESTRKVYDYIQRYLETLEKRSVKSYLDFRRQIDVWEKRLKEDVINLHESSLMEFCDQFQAWFKMQSAINSSTVGKEKREAYKLSNNTAVDEQDESYKSNSSEMTTSCKDDTEFLHKIEHIVKFEVQQHRNDLVKQMDQKIAELWLAFENFKHNFHLDRDYRRHNYIEISNETEDSNDFTCQEAAKSYLNTDSEERCT